MVPKCVTVVTFGGSEVKKKRSQPGPILLPSVAPEGTPPAMLLKQLAFGISFEDEGPMSSAWGPGDTSCLFWDGGFGKTFLGQRGAQDGPKKSKASSRISNEALIGCGATVNCLQCLGKMKQMADP